MALTQMQLIQSLGEALAWFEREINWGCRPTQLTHLCGRIGELYVAILTNGQLAQTVNQEGYDVVSGDGERISVKTTAQVGYEGQVSFNRSTLSQVDRVIVLRIDTEAMQVELLLDQPVAEAKTRMSDVGGRSILPLRRLIKKSVNANSARVVKEVAYGKYQLKEFETGSIEIYLDDVRLSPAQPVFRRLALELNVGLLNGNGNPMNTRQLGDQLIRSIEALNPAKRPAEPEILTSDQADAPESHESERRL